MSAAELIDRHLSRLKPADRRALAIVSVFLAVVFGYVYLIEPLLIRYDQAHAALTELSDQQRRYARQQRMLARRELKLAEYRAQWANLNRHFELQADSVEAAVSRAINELSYYARLTEVTVNGMRPLEALGSGDYVEVGLEVEASAGYEQLHAFLYYIETSPALLAVTDLDLSAQPGEPAVAARFKLANIVRLRNADAGADGAPVPVARKNRLQLVISRWTGYAPLVVAKHNGYLDSDSRRVELLLIDDRVTVERLLVSGQADGVGTSLPELLDYWAKGLPLKAVLPLGSSAGTEAVVARAGSALRTLNDLRGQRVAVAPEGLLQFVLSEALTTAGAGLGEVRVDALGPSQVARQIASGTLDAGVTREPFLSRLVNDNQARVLYSSEQLPGPGLIVDLLAMTPDVIEKKAATLQFLIDGLLRAQRFIAEQPDQALAVIADWEGRQPALTAASLEKLSWFDAPRAQAFFAAERLNEQLATFEKHRQETGRPLPLVTAADLVTADFLTKANSEHSAPRGGVDER